MNIYSEMNFETGAWKEFIKKDFDPDAYDELAAYANYKQEQFLDLMEGRIYNCNEELFEELPIELNKNGIECKIKSRTLEHLILQIFDEQTTILSKFQLEGELQSFKIYHPLSIAGHVAHMMQIIEQMRHDDKDGKYFIK